MPEEIGGMKKWSTEDWLHHLAERVRVLEERQILLQMLVGLVELPHAQADREFEMDAK